MSILEVNASVYALAGLCHGYQDKINRYDHLLSEDGNRKHDISVIWSLYDLDRQ
jgi:hypothetical protein